MLWLELSQRLIWPTLHILCVTKYIRSLIIQCCRILTHIKQGFTGFQLLETEPCAGMVAEVWCVTLALY